MSVPRRPHSDPGPGGERVVQGKVETRRAARGRAENIVLVIVAAVVVGPHLAAGHAIGEAIEQAIGVGPEAKGAISGAQRADRKGADRGEVEAAELENLAVGAHNQIRTQRQGLGQPMRGAAMHGRPVVGKIGGRVALVANQPGLQHVSGRAAWRHGGGLGEETGLLAHRTVDLSDPQRDVVGALRQSRRVHDLIACRIALRAEETILAEDLDLRPARQENDDWTAADLLAIKPGIGGASGARAQKTPLPEQR